MSKDDRYERLVKEVLPAMEYLRNSHTDEYAIKKKILAVIGITVAEFDYL